MKTTASYVEFQNYFDYMARISIRGRIYKRLVSSPILFLCARAFGSRLLEVGSGIGAGVLGAFPSRVSGVEINPLAVEYARRHGMRVSRIDPGGSFPHENASFDACILDNVLEHLENPRPVLDECWRATTPAGGMVIAVPGKRGFAADPDHRVFYTEEALRRLDRRWTLLHLFSLPLLVPSRVVSNSLRQYCLVAIYRKNR